MQKHCEKFGISDKRGRVQTSQDPFQPEMGIEEPALCSGCGAVYINKHWTIDPAQVSQVQHDPEHHLCKCPACQKFSQNYAEGYMVLKGDYLWAHEEEIRALLSAQERKVMAKNPLARVIRMEQDQHDLKLETTEKKLVEHLGRALHKAHQGQLNVSWDDDHTLCRVSWERNL